MRVFLTGATGFIGSAIIPELIKAGHQVLGMTRSDAGAARLKAAGAKLVRADLEEPGSLRRSAADSDGVIHCAFDHDFANFVANCEKDARAIAALADALKGSDRPLLITSGVGLGMADDGKPGSEDVVNFNHPNPRKASEEAGEKALQAGVNVSVVRLPQVHDPLKFGLISPAIEVARAKGVSAYIGDGRNRWPAAHVLDVARLYALAFDKRKTGARYHAVAEEGVAMREIAEVIGKGLKVPAVSIKPEQAFEHFGWLGAMAGLDMSASSAKTRAELNWTPTGPGLIADLEKMQY